MRQSSCLLLALACLNGVAFGQVSSPESGGRTGPISGYMEMHLNKPVDDPVAPTILDFHRFVLLFSHSFTPRLRFVGELELEHAVVEGLEEAGELELEQAYLDVLMTPAFTSVMSRRRSTASSAPSWTP